MGRKKKQLPLTEQATYMVLVKTNNDKICLEIFNGEDLNYTNANNFAKEMLNKPRVTKTEIAVLEKSKPKVFASYIASPNHRILIFDVNDNGSIKDETMEVYDFKGTHDEAINLAQYLSDKRNQEEPLGVSEEWGELKYITHVWTLDENENEVELIYQ